MPVKSPEIVTIEAPFKNGRVKTYALRAADAEWLFEVLRRLPGHVLPYWCSPLQAATIKEATPYAGAFLRGYRGYCASVTLICYRDSLGTPCLIDTVIEAREAAALVGLPLPPGSCWS